MFVLISGSYRASNQEYSYVRRAQSVTKTLQWVEVATIATNDVAIARTEALEAVKCWASQGFIRDRWRLEGRGSNILESIELSVSDTALLSPTPNPCPIAPCLGTMHSRGKNRPPKCCVCGYPNRPKGRPRKNSDRLVTDRDAYQAKKQCADRAVKYALFDPMLLPKEAIGIVHRSAFVGVVVGRSRVLVERDRPGFKAVPIGSLTIREKRWAMIE